MFNIVNSFREVSDEEKINLWNYMTDIDRKNLFSWLSIDEIKKFISSLDVEEKKHAYQFFDKNKLRGYYKKLSLEEKRELLAHLNEKSISLLVEKDRLDGEIKKSSDSITNAFSEIEKSKETIVNSKQGIKNTKAEIKINKVSLKKASKEEKKRYKKMLKRSRPSALDKIGFISKIRSNRLVEATELYLQASKELDKYKIKDVDLKNTLDNLENTIVEEKQKIKDNSVLIKNETENIKKSSDKLGEVRKTIKKLDKEEKKKYGRMLHRKQVDARKRVAVISKQKADTLEKVDDIDVVKNDVLDNDDKTIIVDTNYVNSKNDGSYTKENVENCIAQCDKLTENGVTFYPPAIYNPIIDLGNNQRIPINNISVEQLITMYAAMNYYCMMQLQKQQQEMGMSRVKSKGLASFGLLVGIVIFLLIMMIFVF